MTVKWNAENRLVIDGGVHSKLESEAIAEAIQFYRDGSALERVMIWLWYKAWNNGFETADKNPRQPESMGR